VLREVDRAVNHGVNVLALRIGDFALSRNLEYFISMCHWLDAGGLDPQVCIRQVCTSAQAILAQGGGPAPAQTFSGGTRAPGAESAPAVPPLAAGICDAAFLRRVEAELAVHLGPIARHLVRQAAGLATSNQALVAALAAELASDAERQQFVQRCRGLS
jgi:hypothetical protein